MSKEMREQIDRVKNWKQLSSYQHIGHKEECSKCKNLEYKLSESERENEVFRKSVMERRKTDRVWIEGDSVMYGGR